MNLEFRNARFTDNGADVEINGHACQVDSLWSIVREGLCVVRGPREIVEMLHVATHPDDPKLQCCDEWALVELAARYWRITSTTNGMWKPGAVEILHDRAEAVRAWAGHVEALEGGG